MAPHIQPLAEIEGPVHIEVALQRMREAWDIGRIGLQILSTIEAAITLAEVPWDGIFLGRTDGAAPCVRYPADGVTRKVDHISDDELQLALESLVREGGRLAGRSC